MISSVEVSISTGVDIPMNESTVVAVATAKVENEWKKCSNMSR